MIVRAIVFAKKANSYYLHSPHMHLNMLKSQFPRNAKVRTNMKTTGTLPPVCLLMLLACFAILFKPIANDLPLSSSNEAEKKPNDWFFLQRAFPLGRIDQRAHLRAVQQARAMRSLRKNSTAANWSPIGPGNIGGRITAIAVHPFDPNIIYIGAAAGGVFQSTDGGNNWFPIFDDQPSLSIGALAIDPNKPEIIYAGTGEANGSFDSYAGDGIYKSTDGGLTWQNMGLVESDHIGRIA